MRTIKVALIGTGFAADLHVKAYRLIPGVHVKLIGITSRHRENAERFCLTHDLDNTIIFENAEQLIQKVNADIIDLVVPTWLHVPLAILAAENGKHVICEKPLTGYFGDPEIPIEQRENVGKTDKKKMLRKVLEDCKKIHDVFKRNLTRFCYAENWVYAPSITKAKRLLQSSRGKILEMRCGEGHSGSHSQYSSEWKYTGGGSLLRMGAHPFGAAIHFKIWEGMIREGKPIYPKSIIATTARYRDFLDKLPPEQDYIRSRPKDVEDWSCGILTFNDNTNAVIFGSDVTLGGIENWMNIYASNVRIECKISNNNSLMAYAPTELQFRDEYTIEKIETKAGWSHAQPDEEWMTGYPFEMQDFVESVLKDKEPISNLDLAIWTTKAMYSAYLSAEMGQRIEIPKGFSLD
ncbi:MAG: Gfo/Idh/MocA family protein [Promethearchaeota archaeon]